MLFYMISSENVKRSFKVVLDSFNTNSFTGSQFNANYNINLQTIINDEKAFDKQYLVYCNFITKSESIANNQITSTNIYTLSLNFNNSSNNLYQFEQYKNFSFTLPVQSIIDTGGSNHTLLRLDDNNQRPLFIQNIRNLTNIYLNVWQNNITAEQIFNPTTPDNSKYICTLTFVEA